MLVLSRQRDECIIIGDNIVITVVEIRGDKVRLGINAPPEIPVHRQEVYEAIIRENLRANRSNSPVSSNAKPNARPGGNLVLSRQRDESIVIGENIVLTVVDIRGDKVRLGVHAPTEIPVHRQEVYEAIQRDNLRASRNDPKDVRKK